MAQLASPAAYGRSDVERVVRDVLVRHFASVGSAPSKPNPLVVNISARHVHLSPEHLEVLFGKGAQLEVQKELYQDGFFAATWTSSSWIGYPMARCTP